MIVTTQAELDAAIERGEPIIDIRSERGVWLDVRAYDSSTVTACGSSTVRAYDSSTVTACGSSTVRAYDSSTVTSYDSSTVTSYGSSTVRAYDSSTVRACGSSTVRAYDSSTVRACGSSTVTACGSSTVRAYDSSTVRAYGSSTVRAYDSSTVTARPGVAVHLHSRRATVTGGVLIDHTNEPTNPAEWCAYHGIKVTDGIATVYKAVGDDWCSPHGTSYAPGSTPEAPDWEDSNNCGGGLHFSPTPVEATAYHPEATRWLAVGVSVADLRPILGGTPKCKAPRVATPCRPVTIDGDPIEVQS
ncbi:DUF7666 domain-containing protein [Collinsella sp. Sow4_E3]|uniref:DUF7666 domain-containing protein n=1 Tax=Collinsella sp. Sow4_E3 TaxID=3438776 RepID=UPI003F8DFDC2